MEKRILIIDDDVAVQKSFRYALADEGYQLSYADSGEAGIAAARHDPPDLVFLDLRMPGMDGIETLRELRKEMPEIPIYIVTAYRGDYLSPLRQAREQGLRFEIADKPLNDEQIRQIAAGFLRTAQLNLFFAGNRQQAEQACAGLRKAFLRRGISVHLTMIDVLEEFTRAMEHDVFATPMLLRVSPAPQRRVVGDLSDPEAIIEQLGFGAADDQA